MTDEIVAALIGVIAALLGTWWGFRLTEAAGQRRERLALHRMLQQVRTELSSQLSLIKEDAFQAPLHTAAYDILMASSDLGELPPALTEAIVGTYLSIARVNETLRDRDSVFYALVAAKNPDPRTSMEAFIDRIGEARQKAFAEAQKALEALDTHIASRAS